MNEIAGNFVDWIVQTFWRQSSQFDYIALGRLHSVRKRAQYTKSSFQRNRAFVIDHTAIMQERNAGAHSYYY